MQGFKLPTLLPLLALFFAYLLSYYSPVLSLLCGLALGFFMLGLSLLNTYPQLRQGFFRLALFLALSFLFSLRISYLDDFSLRDNARVKASMEQVQSQILARLETSQLSKKTQTLASAMALGHIERDEEGQAIRQDFIGSGVAHILAVSGFHLALLLGLIALIISPLPYYGHYKRLKLLILILVAWAFVWLTGASRPTIRAAFMLSLYLFGQGLERPVSMPNILTLSLLIQLLLSPSLVVSAGFWLSHVAVLSIYLFYIPIYRLFGDISFAPLSYAWEVIALTCSVQILLIPLCFYFFGGVSWAFIFTTLPMTLLATLFIPLSLIFFLFNALGFSPVFFEEMLNFFGNLISQITAFASSIDGFYQELILPLWALCLYYALVFLALFYSKRVAQRKQFQLK